MKNTINKIFSDETDEDAHFEFVKFGKGIYGDRYLIEAKKQKEGWSIKTSSEFANFFVLWLLEKAPEKLAVKGAIITTLDIEKDILFEVEDIKRYMGIRQFLINAEIQKKNLIELMNKYPRGFYALSFSINGSELRIKPKAPKSGKPGSSTKNDDGPKADFCFLKTNDKEIVNDMLFDLMDFNSVKVKHAIEIKEIEIPTGIKEPEKMREMAKRKGAIKRFLNVDGKEKVAEKSFVV